MKYKIILLGLILSLICATKAIPSEAAYIGGDEPLAGLSLGLKQYYKSEDAYTQEDLELLANVMYHENYCNGDYIMYLTGCVVLNRVDYCKWCPNTVKGVLYQKGQYATVPKFYTKEIPKHVYQMAAVLLITRSTIPENVIYQAMFKQGSGCYDPENTWKKCGEYFCYE